MLTKPNSPPFLKYFSTSKLIDLEGTLKQSINSPINGGLATAIFSIYQQVLTIDFQERTFGVVLWKELEVLDMEFM
jgi:hypothetical protein